MDSTRNQSTRSPSYAGSNRSSTAESSRARPYTLGPSRPLRSAPSPAPERPPFGRRHSVVPPHSLTPPPPLPSDLPALPIRPCEVCECVTLPTFYCVNCDGNFCDDCWRKERAHKPGKLGPDGLPHEKADPRIVNRLKEAFQPPTNPEIQARMHMEDEDTTWFGIARDSANVPMFQDYGRYATLMANSSSGEIITRYPQLVSFIGQTGAGKSTIVKLLIEQQGSQFNDHSRELFPTPVVGSVRNDNVPTSGDVHLYADPATYLGPLPMLYADCEGLEGGESTPISARHREHEPTGSRKRAESSPERKLQKKRFKIARGAQRDIAWANSPETRKRQYAVTELYPRLLYTFSDVIGFVLQNAKSVSSFR
jgi:energy-coupling factor transporter ATP-binding protein EcfA2